MWNPVTPKPKPYDLFVWSRNHGALTVLALRPYARQFQTTSLNDADEPGARRFCSALHLKRGDLADSLRTGNAERAVDQRLHALEEAYRMRQSPVILVPSGALSGAKGR